MKKKAFRLQAALFFILFLLGTGTSARGQEAFDTTLDDELAKAGKFDGQQHSSDYAQIKFCDRVPLKAPRPPTSDGVFPLYTISEWIEPEKKQARVDEPESALWRKDFDLLLDGFIPPGIFLDKKRLLRYWRRSKYPLVLDWYRILANLTDPQKKTAEFYPAREGIRDEQKEMHREFDTQIGLNLEHSCHSSFHMYGNREIEYAILIGADDKKTDRRLPEIEESETHGLITHFMGGERVKGLALNIEGFLITPKRRAGLQLYFFNKSNHQRLSDIAQADLRSRIRWQANDLLTDNPNRNAPIYVENYKNNPVPIEERRAIPIEKLLKRDRADRWAQDHLPYLETILSEMEIADPPFGKDLVDRFRQIMKETMVFETDEETTDGGPPSGPSSFFLSNGRGAIKAAMKGISVLQANERDDVGRGQALAFIHEIAKETRTYGMDPDRERKASALFTGFLKLDWKNLRDQDKKTLREAIVAYRTSPIDSHVAKVSESLKNWAANESELVRQMGFSPEEIKDFDATLVDVQSLFRHKSEMYRAIYYQKILNTPWAESCERVHVEPSAIVSKLWEITKKVSNLPITPAEIDERKEIAEKALRDALTGNSRPEIPLQKSPAVRLDHP
jgi:hypothetical protein